MANAARRILACGLVMLLMAVQEAPAQQFTFRQYGQEEGLANLALSCLGVGGHFRAIRPEGRNLIVDPGLRLAALSADRVLVLNKDQLLELHFSPQERVWHSAPYFTPEELNAHPGLQHLSSLGVDRLGRVWLGCGTEICAVQHGRVDSWGTGAGVPEDTWRSWLVDREGQLWARGLKHVVVLKAGATRFETRDPPHSKLTSDILNVPLTADRENRIIVRNDVGLARWNEGRWEEFTAKNGLPSVSTAALLVSRDGTLWLGTSGHGLSRWLGYGNFEAWTVAQGLDADAVWSVLRSASRGIVLGTRAGCYRIDETLHRGVPCSYAGMPPGESSS